ncbi:MAG: 50S ribosomal protein L27 [Candidatus Stahlbacteria bacterium]|nr:MAG: 50S ribosomal protein L27 [Candidatus Stahlbacteria bacterium]
MAHKKGGGVAKNNRDSAGRRLGVKIHASQQVKTGQIIIRQRGTKIMPGRNVGRAKDDTLFALADGVIRFEHVTKRKKRVVVVPAE